MSLLSPWSYTQMGCSKFPVGVMKGFLFLGSFEPSYSLLAGLLSPPSSPAPIPSLFTSSEIWVALEGTKEIFTIENGF